MPWTTLWVVFCFAALALLLWYLVARRPGPWFGRDRGENYPYMVDRDGDDGDPD